MNVARHKWGLRPERPPMIRVTREHPCPVCGKPDWCLRRADGSAAICRRVDSSVKAGVAGHLHILAEGDPLAAYTPRQTSVAPPPPDLTPLAGEYAEGLDADGGRDRLADDLGVGAQALARLGVGYSPRSRATTWPMRQRLGGPVTGIRYRAHNGRKWSERGGREGLFAPHDLPSRAPIMLIAEGATDTAAGLTLGLPTIGRPSARTGIDLAAWTILLLAPQAVIVCADHDSHGAGQQGADDTAKRIRLLADGDYRPDVYIWTAPAACKDLRGYVRAGGDAETLVGGTGVRHVAR